MDKGLNYTTSEIEMEPPCASNDSGIHVNSLNNLDESYPLQLALTMPGGTGGMTSKEDKEEE